MKADWHPMQPVVWDSHGVIRFKANAIVQYLLDAGPFDMNHLAVMPFSDADREQFAQLIGYSVSGIGDLHYVRRSFIRRADRRAARLLATPPSDPASRSDGSPSR